MLPDFTTCDRDDFYSPTTISLGELMEGGGFTWDMDFFDAIEWYSPEQEKRWKQKFEARFYSRDIGVLPPGRWLRLLGEALRELMPKYNLLYKALDQGVSIIQLEDTYHKGRTIGSDFPQTMLNGSTQDYASSGQDTEYETVRNGPFLELLERFKYYKDADAMLLDECEKLFSCLLTVNMNGF